MPLRVFQCSMSCTNRVGQLAAVELLEERDLRVDGRDDERRAELLTALEHHAAHGRPAVRILSTGAFTRTSAPKNLADSSHAFATAPMPPSMKPQLATSPSPMSPTEWCISTYAVPGASGPAQVPMMPLTAMKPFICGVSNHRSSRSVALIVNRRVMSATVCSSTCLRSFHPSLATSLMSRGLPRAEVRRRLHQQRAEDVGDPADPLVELEVRVGVPLRELRDRPRVFGRRRAG